MRWKDFLYFQRNSKTAVILLLILIVLTLILNILLRYRGSSDIVLKQNDSLIREFEEFRQSLTVRKPLSDDNLSGKGEGERGRSYGKAGSAHRDTSLYNNRIASQRYASREGERYYSRSTHPATVKLSRGETISLNKSDTTQWKKIPGIGSAYAARIVRYRELLGGFVEAEQLMEVYGVDQELFSGIVVYIEPDGDIRRLQVNQADFKELLRHPYLNYKQVQVIVSLRRKKGDISSMRELSFLDEFTPEDIFRLEPYLEF